MRNTFLVIFSGRREIIPKNYFAYRTTNEKSPYNILIMKALNIITWCGAGSNRRHKDFQSFALPTELPHHWAAKIELFN